MESYFWSPETLNFGLSGMVALQRYFEPKHFLIREMVKTPLILHSGVQEDSKGKYNIIQVKITY